MKNAGIETGAPEEKEMHSTIRVNGTIEVPPANIASVSAPLGGYIKKTALIPGQKVNKGSVLATLEDQQYIQLQQDYLTAQSRLAFLEADYTRQKGLNETKATSDKIFQEVASNFQSQKVLLRSLAEKLRLIGINPETLNENTISRTVHLYAPFSGYITRVNVNMGKYAGPTDVLFELINPDDLHLTLTVFENDASRLSVGQKITCSTNSHPGEKYSATIVFITPSIGEERSTEVHCDFDNRSKLLPGTYMNATIELTNARLRAVPDDAVVKWQNRYYLFGVEGSDRFRMIPVDVSESSDGYTAIQGALPATRIVTKNAYTILMKMKNSGEEE
ncbi:cation efflux system protein CzcB [Flavihumibacter petaseus NBRC 106054]|uniref:Cation efflux system protein CzcB n=2 Tax=Flavihumibacter TaxID=1004301 RepID=A0A0E9N6R9_9BACT|nr:cation efflux system protein CzcB [Flavihumibacter petaseus NBRC 106054]